MKQLLLILAGCVALASWAAPLPIAQDPTHRFLVDASGKPFFLNADSAWSLLSKLDYADQAAYFINRASNGFNAVLIDLVAPAYAQGTTKLKNGTGLWTDTISRRYPRLTAINPAYLMGVSNTLYLAATNGLLVFIDPLDYGGFVSTATNNGNAACYTYGTYLGNFFKGFTNVAWCDGNDWAFGVPASDAAFSNIAFGIYSITQQVHTTDSTPLTRPGDTLSGGAIVRPWATLNGVYTWSPTYDIAYQAWESASHLASVLMEAHYEEEAIGWPVKYHNTDMGTPYVIRKQAWWSACAGSLGGFYGDSYIWKFAPGWQRHLNTTGVYGLRQWASFFTARQWWKLVPDTHNVVLTAGYGDYDTLGPVSTNMYATCCSTPDGTLAVIYCPTNLTLTVNMGAFPRAVTARCFDPTSGLFSRIAGSPFANTGSQTFTGFNNRNGDGDMVLDLEAPVVGVLSGSGTAQ